MKLIRNVAALLLIAAGTPALLPAQGLGGWIEIAKRRAREAAEKAAKEKWERLQQEAIERARLERERMENLARAKEAALIDKIPNKVLPVPDSKPNATDTGVVPAVSTDAPLQTNEATMLVFKPPMQFLGGRTARIVADTRNPAFADYNLLGLRLEQALREGFTVEKGTADLVFTFAVVDYRRPAGKTSNVREIRLVRTPSGQLINGPVTVAYFEATGAMNLELTVRDAKGTMLGSHTAKPKVAMKFESSVNGTSVLKGRSLPSDAELLDGLLTQCMEDVAKEFVPTTRKVPVRLAVDKELRDGFEFARANEWDRAVAAWRNAKTGDEADRALNLGVGNEALAYQALLNSRNPQDALPLLEEAIAQYERFLQKKPGMFGDKNRAIALRTRLAGTKANIDRAKEREEFEKHRLELAGSQEVSPVVQPAVHRRQTAPCRNPIFAT